MEALTTDFSNVYSSFHPNLSNYYTAVDTDNSTIVTSNSAEFYNSSLFEEEIRREFQITLRTYFYELYKKRKKEELYDVPWTLIILLSILYGSLSVISFFGNGLVIWVVLVSRKMRTVTNMYIVNLAVADVIIGLFAIPFQFQAALLQRWHLPEFMCAFCPFFQVLSVNLSVFTLCAVALDRHRAVLQPLKPQNTKTQAIILIACIWVIAILLALPSYLDYKVVTTRKIFMPPHPYCRNVGLSSNIRLVYNLGLVGAQYFVPLIVISVAYIRMGIRLWRRTVPGNKEDYRDALLLKSKKRVIKMLALVVLLFGVCWLPLQIYNFVQQIYPNINNFQYINVVWFCIHWLAMSNSCVNPFIYGIYNEKFQDEFSNRLGRMGRCCCIFKRNRAPILASRSEFGNGSRVNFRSSVRLHGLSFTRPTAQQKLRRMESHHDIARSCDDDRVLTNKIEPNRRIPGISDVQSKTKIPHSSTSPEASYELADSANTMRNGSNEQGQVNRLNRLETQCEVIGKQVKHRVLTTNVEVLVRSHSSMV